MNNLEKIINVFKSKRNIIIILIIIIFLFLALFICFESSDDNSSMYDQIESDLRESAIKFIKEHKLEEDNIFLSFETLGYKINSACANTGGIYVLKDGEKYNYEYYYSCKNRESDAITKVKKENKKLSKYLVLHEENPLYLKNKSEYFEPGYVLKKGKLTIVENISEENGVYYINYRVSHNNKEYVLKRIVILEELELYDVDDESNIENPSLTLVGDLVVKIKLGEEYKEAGYIAQDTIDGDITNNVVIDSDLDVNKIGIYVITYTVTNSSNKSVSVTREVIVENIDSSPIITLKGSSTINLKVGEKYNEPGYSATDEKDGDITNKVIVKNNINLKKEGTYEITYKVTNSNNKTTIVTRKIIVSELSVPSIKLNGNSTIKLKVGEKYNEPGYSATDKKDGNITNKVVVKSALNTARAGTYKITYTITNSDNKTASVIRTIIVSELSVPTIKLKGSSTVNLELGEKYIEPGYNATDEKDGNITNKVVVNSNLDINTEGTYKITYTINNSDNKSASVTRTIVVKKVIREFTYTTSVTPMEYTNDYVTITFKMTGEGYDYILKPDNTTSSNKTINYKVSDNGTYIFKLYNVDGSSKVETIKITNIDKEKPTGSCVATINQANTIIEVNASDNNSIYNYIYMDNSKVIGSSNYNYINYNDQTSTNVLVKIFDVASNSAIINCKVIDNSYFVPIKPSSGETIVKQEETDTLNVYISKAGSYYLTRVWAKNPYQQLNKFDSPEYGVNLYKPKVLLEKAISSKSLQNKLIVGFNASGFYLKNTYDSDSVAKYPAYDRTSVGTLVITDGKIVRNAYDKSYKTWYTTGIDKNNKLRIFEDYKTDDSNAKKNWATDVYNTGIRNTFTFASPLVENGVKSSNTTSMPSISSKVGRQAICQVNENNFVLITGSSLNRNDLINIMLDLDCETGTNLDGGGSIALLYKASTSSTIETIIGNGRNLPEVGYFVQ